MHLQCVFKHFSHRERKGVFLYIIVWITSLLVGILLCSASVQSSVDLFRDLFCVSPTVFGRVTICVFPIVIAASCFFPPLFVLSYFALASSGVAYGFCGCMIYLAWGSAAWALRPLLLFSAGSSSALMWWLIITRTTRIRMLNKIRCISVLSCVIFLIDLFVVSPIVGDLSKYF